MGFSQGDHRTIAQPSSEFKLCARRTIASNRLRPATPPARTSPGGSSLSHFASSMPGARRSGASAPMKRESVTLKDSEMLRTVFYLVVIVAGLIYIIEKVGEALG